MSSRVGRALGTLVAAWNEALEYGRQQLDEDEAAAPPAPPAPIAPGTDDLSLAQERIRTLQGIVTARNGIIDEQRKSAIALSERLSLAEGRVAELAAAVPVSRAVHRNRLLELSGNRYWIVETTTTAGETKNVATCTSSTEALEQLRHSVQWSTTAKVGLYVRLPDQDAPGFQRLDVVEEARGEEWTYFAQAKDHAAAAKLVAEKTAFAPRGFDGLFGKPRFRATTYFGSATELAKAFPRAKIPEELTTPEHVAPPAPVAAPTVWDRRELATLREHNLDLSKQNEALRTQVRALLRDASASLLERDALRAERRLAAEALTVATGVIARVRVLAMNAEPSALRGTLRTALQITTPPAGAVDHGPNGVGC